MATARQTSIQNMGLNVLYLRFLSTLLVASGRHYPKLCFEFESAIASWDFHKRVKLVCFRHIQSSTRTIDKPDKQIQIFLGTLLPRNSDCLKCHFKSSKKNHSFSAAVTGLCLSFEREIKKSLQVLSSNMLSQWPSIPNLKKRSQN